MKAMKESYRDLVKKASGMLLITLFIGMLCGCIAADESGKVTYQLGASKVKLSSMDDLKQWEKIENIYVKALKGIQGAEPDSSSDNAILMEGVYSKTDAAVVKACEDAEKSAAAITLSDGYIVMEVSATYWSGATREVVYTHTFGQP